MIAEILDAYANRRRRFDRRREATVGASEIGQCARKVFYLKNAGDRDADHIAAWGAQLRGRIFERAFWVPALRTKYGDRLKFAGGRQRRFKSGVLSATPDALLVNVPPDILAPLGVPDIKSDCLLLEAKTIDPRARLDGPKPEHLIQAIVQLGLVREVTDLKPVYAVISYTDASFWSETIEFAVKFDPKIFESAKQRAIKIMTARSAAEIRPEGFIAGAHECRFCPFTKVCGIARHAIPDLLDATDPQFIVEARKLAHKAKRREIEVEAAANKLRTIQYEIREQLRARGLRRIRGKDFSITWSPLKGRGSFDVKALKAAAAAAGLDVSEFETAGELTDRLDVRVHSTLQNQE
jgi:hypothetical protein